MYSDFRTWAKHQHDVVCNQKYNKTLPYSVHLDGVAHKVSVFYTQDFNFKLHHAMDVAYGHDLIEDARVTYNDVKNASNEIVAEAVFNCTESVGRNRAERHDAAYIERIFSSELSLFVKLCDLAANITFGLFQAGNMIGKYKEEFPTFEARIKLLPNYKKFVPIINHINNLLVA